jgi:TatD DNase family protein
MPRFYDTHAHLDSTQFKDEVAQVLERAQAAGIAKIIAVGTDLESSTRAIQLSEQFDSVFAAVGWYPGEALRAPADLRSALRELARHPKVVALGETGLDYSRLPSAATAAIADANEHYKHKQAELFRQHLEVAAELNLNCVVHQRAAFEDVLRQMQPFVGRVRGVFHCFTNGVAEMQRVLAMGSLVSYTGIVSFKNAQNVRDTLAATPLDRLMLETDCPYLAPVPFRGKRCEPAYVKEISETAAQVKGCSLAALSEATCATAEQFFPRLPPG